MKTVENKNVGTPYVINGQPVPALEYAAHCKSIIEGLKPERERYYIAMQVPGISDEDHDDLVAEYFEADATIKECIADIAKITGEEIVDEAPMGKWWNTKPEVKATADEFTAKLAAFDAEITHAETARDAAKAAYDKADTDAQNAIAARWNFLDKTAGALTEKLHAIPPHRDYIGTATLSGCPVTFMDFDNVYVDATLGGKFNFVTFNNRVLARYDTPAQVETVIGKLKDAVDRHKTVFHFPTVDELIDTPVEPDISKKHIGDSLTRAMKTALEKFQQFCLVKNLTAAENELKLYNICRLATRELWR